MRTILLKSVLSITFALSAISFAPVASAQDLEIDIGREGPRLRLSDDCNPRYEDCRDGIDEDFRYERRREEARYARRGCSEERALDKAERIGLRRVSIVSAGRRVIEVRGRDRRGNRVMVEFGREPNCPIL